MTLSRTTAVKKALTLAAAAITACILAMGCSAPAYAREIPGAAPGRTASWALEANHGGNTYGSYVGGTGAGDGGNGSESAGENEGSGDGTGTGENSEESRPEGESSGGSSVEPGFSTPGNGNLGDQIRSSGGKDFYTVRTKNNNTFYLVIDHSNTTENVYMLSLIDENDLAEFLSEETKKEETPAAPVIIPETKPQAEPTPGAEKTQAQQPSYTSIFQSSTFWIVLAALCAVAALYYFRIYRPKHEEEADDSEGIENEDFPTESEG